ncbi:hypothetical protein [Flectobacillus major]|uniref:hypothetical protein n=1 Tax=Flectobacillus major TaxID=103 RepID=UPI0011831482|nr:hypothetical protein [Flectobacillus major]
MIVSCINTPAQRVRNAQNKVVEANKDLNKANEEYVADIQNYRHEIADKILENNQSIAKLNAQKKLGQAPDNIEYNQKVADLEQKNNEMRVKLDNYKLEGKDQWQVFKTKFSQDMDNLGTAVKTLVSKIK